MTPDSAKSPRSDSPAATGPSYLQQNKGPRRHGRPGGYRGGRRSGPGDPGKSSRVAEIPDDKEQPVELDGTVSAVLAGTMFRVKLRNGHEVLAHISGKMRKRFIRLVIGDQVKLEMSQYDTEKARIVYRM